MGDWEHSNIEMDFSGDDEGYIPDSHLAKRFPVTAVNAKEFETETDKAA